MILSSHAAPTGYHKKVLVTVCLFLVFCANGGAYGGPAGDIPPGRGSTGGNFGEMPLQGTVSTEEQFERFDDFIIRLKDNREEDRILVCSVAVQLNRGMRLPEERISLRKIIYRILKGQSGTAEIGKALKEEIKIRLNEHMGGERIRNVYFTKFVVL
jgi:flagellar basal body-associated protein FliL